jgi:exo-beta-1,3-glucanase (GH17 family)
MIPIQLASLSLALLLPQAVQGQQLRELDAQAPMHTRLSGVAFSPWSQGEDPNLGATITLPELTARLAPVLQDAEWIRSYGVDAGLEHIGPLVHAAGLSTAVTAWIGTDQVANAAEVQSLIDLANAGHVDLAIVGNEVLLRGDLSKADLITHIRNARLNIPAEIPVTTAEVWPLWLMNPDLVAEMDVLGAHVHGYWEGVPIESAMDHLHCQVGRLRLLAGGKDVVVLETGWPTCGPALGGAQPSLANALRYTAEVASWSQFTGIRTFTFAALDEPFKVLYEGPVGACWGYRDTSGTFKPGARRVFESARFNPGWSFDFLPGGPGTPALVYANVPPIGSDDLLEGVAAHVNPLLHRVVTYIRVGGGWWVKPSVAEPFGELGCDGSWATDIVTGGNDAQADRIETFLMPAGATPTIVLGVGALPAHLYAEAVATAAVDRP